jgi:heme exporter protein B
MIALFRRELALVLRSGGGFGLTLGFYLVFVTVLPLALGPDRALLAEAAPGILWSGALLAALLSLDRLFQPDFEDGSLELLALSPLPLPLVAAVKAAAHWVTTGLPLVAAAPFLAVMLNYPLPAVPALLSGLMAGTLALSFLGAAGAALVLGLRHGGLLLPLIVLPLALPVLIFGSRAAQLAAEGQDQGSATALLLAVTLLTAALTPAAAARALRAHLTGT